MCAVQGKQYPANMLDQVTQGIAGLAQPSDHLEYAAKGRGMLVYPISGPELDGESFRRFWNAAHKNKAVSGALRAPQQSQAAIFTLLWKQDVLHKS